MKKTKLPKGTFTRLMELEREENKIEKWSKRVKFWSLNRTERDMAIVEWIDRNDLLIK